MNRLYTLACLALIGGSLSAQQRASLPLRPAKQESHKDVRAVRGHAKDGGDIVFSEDFANGLNGNNGVGAWTTNAANGNLWKQTFTGPHGAYSDTSEKIHSTTYLNGWMIIQTDSANSIWTDPLNPVIVANPVNFDAGLVSPLLDLSATPSVQIEFQQRLRYCCQDAPNFLQVSTDGGTTWSATFPCAEGIDGNQDDGTMTKSINITAAIAANPANVKFRFFHDGTTSGTSHYHWQVDDVKITTTASNDLRMTNAASWSWDFNTAATYDSLDYSIIPLAQLHVLPLNVSVFNNGRVDQPNTTAHFNVTNSAGTSVFSQDVNIGTLASGVTDTIYADGFTPPASIDEYMVHYSVSSDSTDMVPSDNMDSTTFQVSDYVLARDDDSRDGSYDNPDDNGDPQAFILGNMMHITTAGTIYAVDIAIATGADVGTTVSAQVRNDDRSEALAESNEYDVVAADLCATGGNHMIHFILTEPLDVTAGQDVFVGLHHFGGATVKCATSGSSPAQTSQIYDVPTDTWFYVTSTPMVRINFNANVGIEEHDVQNGVGLGQNFPNPVSTNTTIPYSLTTAAKVTMDIYDVAGKLVKTISEGSKAAGTYRVNVNVSDMQEGVYFYTLTAGEARVTKRMTVVH